MKDLPALGVTDRYRLRELELQLTATVPAGRVMWCRGRKVLGYADVDDLGDVMAIPKGADTLCLSEADYVRVKAWLG